MELMFDDVNELLVWLELEKESNLRHTKNDCINE